MSSTTMPRPSTDAGRHRPPRRPGRRIPAWWRDLAGVLAWASMLVVVALWVTGGGLHDLTDPLSAAGLHPPRPPNRPVSARPSGRAARPARAPLPSDPGARGGGAPLGRGGGGGGGAAPPAPPRRLLV